MKQIPIIDINDLKANKIETIKKIGNGFSEFGFIGIKNHGVSEDLIRNNYKVISEFFALDKETKIKYEKKGIGGARGYTRFGVEVAKDSSHPDLKEFWHVGRETDDSALAELPNIWPNEVPNFKEHTLALYNALDNLGKTVLQAIALFLKLDEHYFDDKINVGNSILRPIHYPAIENAEEGSVRSGQHEDINLITLLVGSNQAGLEILNRDGTWIPVTTIEGTIVCNIGDMLQRATNHVLPSTTHRVVNPKNMTEARYSIPYFLHYNSDVMIETLEGCISKENPNRYEKPIMADDYLKQRLIEIGLLKSE